MALDPRRPGWAKPSDTALRSSCQSHRSNRTGSTSSSSHLASNHHGWKHRPRHPHCNQPSNLVPLHPDSRPRNPCSIHDWRIHWTKLWARPDGSRYWSSPAWPGHLAPNHYSDTIHDGSNPEPMRLVSSHELPNHPCSIHDWMIHWTSHLWSSRQSRYVLRKH